MPLGTPVTETGLLLRDEGGLALRLAGGGQWRLDAPARAASLVGCRVSIQAIRAGYDLLDVRRVEEIGGTGQRLVERQGWSTGLELACTLALPAAALLFRLMS